MVTPIQSYDDILMTYLFNACSHFSPYLVRKAFEQDYVNYYCKPQNVPLLACLTVTSFPGSDQLSVACSTEKRGEPGIFSHVRKHDVIGKFL